MFKNYKILLLLFFSLILVIIPSCKKEAELNEFFFKLPTLNQNILGELKYDDADLDLTTLGIKEYSELYKYADQTKDNLEMFEFINEDVQEQKLLITKDTFYICLKSTKYHFILIDDAFTNELDNIQTKGTIPSIDEFSQRLINE